MVTLVLFGSLIGAYVNIPIARLPGHRVVARALVDIFGIPLIAPVETDYPGTILAVNVGGAVIPVLLSVYLLFRNEIWVTGAVATAIVAAIVHQLATPVPGMGISVPLIAPPLIAAVTALVLSRRNAAPLAYVGGSLGVLIGADILNLGNIQESWRLGRLDRRRRHFRRRLPRRRRRGPDRDLRPAAARLSEALPQPGSSSPARGQAAIGDRGYNAKLSSPAAPPGRARRPARRPGRIRRRACETCRARPEDRARGGAAPVRRDRRSRASSRRCRRR